MQKIYDLLLSFAALFLTLANGTTGVVNDPNFYAQQKVVPMNRHDRRAAAVLMRQAGLRG